MQLNTGTILSGAGHIGLITWLFVGPIFSAEPLPLDAMSVSTISGAEFEALVAETSPNTPTPVVQSIAPPSRPTVSEDTPPVIEVPDEVAIEAPPTLPEAPPPAPEISTALPDTDSAPAPQAADRVAPEAVDEPDPEARTDDVTQEAVTDDSAGETVQPEQEATAPEEATTEIVTEAEEPASAAPLTSRRPPSTRPAAPAPEVVPAVQDTPAETSDTSDAVNDALTEALTETPSDATAPAGPPMSAGEKEAMRVSVSTCWNVGSLSSEALRTTVVVTVSMFETKKPDTGSIRLASFSGGSEAAAKQAFEAARRAIIRCGSRGFDLPSEKYEHWRDIEMTFNPEGMRMK